MKVGLGHRPGGLTTTKDSVGLNGSAEPRSGMSFRVLTCVGCRRSSGAGAAGVGGIACLGFLGFLG